MAYGAVGSLELTIERLLNSSHISIVQNSSPQILKHLYDEILSLKETLEEFDTRRSTINIKMVKTLEAEIIHVVHKFENAIESYVLDQFHSPEEKTDHPPSMLFSLDVHGIKQDVDSFIETVNKMKRAYIHELCNPSPEEEEDGVVPSRIDFGGNESNMVGLSDLFMRIKDRLDSEQSEQIIASLVGMAGIGKTTLAKKLFPYPFTLRRMHLFVTIGPKYRLADILVDILRQVNNADVDEIMLMKGEKLLVGLKRMVLKSLRFLRYFIVLDDVWDRELCIELLKLFPDDDNGSRVLLTTRIYEVAECADHLTAFKIPFLDKKESWELLRHKVFDAMPCPHELEKPGKKIAENCEGLPLTIVTVANILSKADKTLEYWNKVADEKRNSVYKDAYDQMSKVLYPSYDYLDQHLKSCFLYLGAFPQSNWVDGFQLSNLWSAEGFLNSKPMHYSNPAMTSTNVGYDYLDELFSKTVTMFNRETNGYYLHSSFWYLCNKEAAKNKFFYEFNCPDDALQEDVKYQHRLCIRYNVLLAIQDVHDSVASASTVRSLLCTGDFHEYPVPLCLEQLRLLRVFLALSIRFYEFPMEVLELVQLRYFGLTYDGDLPPSISELWNLQYLIIFRHLGIIKYAGNFSYLPIEIWNMKELKCLHATGRDLPHPCEGSLLPNLLQLTGVGPQSCTKDVLEKIPNLKGLAIKIDLPPDATEPLSCFDHISRLHKLEVLECYIVNTAFKAEVATPLAPLSDFPSSLTKLILIGLGYPWGQMSKISSLPNLKHMTLECYAFRGPKWQVRPHEFPKLRFLSIEDTDLEQWTFGNYCCLPSIEVLRIAHCYKLKEIPLAFGTSLENVHIVDCNPLVGDCADELKQYWDDEYGDENSLFVYVNYSCDDGDV